MKTAAYSLFLFAFGAAKLSAEPAYLKCELNNGEKILHYTITVDEATHHVSVALRESGYTFETSGVFSPDAVSFIEHDPEYPADDLVFRINRVDLSFGRTMPSINSRDRGTCVLVKAPKKRKF